MDAEHDRDQIDRARRPPTNKQKKLNPEQKSGRILGSIGIVLGLDGLGNQRYSVISTHPSCHVALMRV